MIGFLCFVISGCGGLPSLPGGDSKDLIFAEISGASEIYENQSASYTADAGGASNLTFEWSCEPPGAGTFTSTNTHSTTFTAAEINTGSITISIVVVVNGDNANTFIKSKPVNILNSN